MKPSRVSSGKAGQPGCGGNRVLEAKQWEVKTEVIMSQSTIPADHGKYWTF